MKVPLDILEHGCPRNIVFRVVDDNPKTYSEFDKQFISENRLSEFQLISPYNHVYYEHHVAKWIPYHYEPSEELSISAEEFIMRNPIPLLTGALDKDIYPTRFMYSESKCIKKLKHPGRTDSSCPFYFLLSFCYPV